MSVPLTKPRLRGWLDEERDFLIGRMQIDHAMADWQKAAAGEGGSCGQHQSSPASRAQSAMACALAERGLERKPCR